MRRIQLMCVALLSFLLAATATGQSLWPAGKVGFSDSDTLQEKFDAGDLTSGGLRSMYWGAGSLSVDGTNCATPAEVTVNSGPKIFTVICTDNDGSIIYGSTNMPDGWDSTVTPVFYFQAINTAADTGVLEFDFSAMCRADGDSVNSTWGSEPTPGSITFTTANDIETSAANAVTPNGTCTADSTHLFWRMSLDATATTTAVATAHLVGVKLEYQQSPSD